MCIRNCMAVRNQNGYRSDHTIYFVFGTTTLRKAAIDKTAKADSTLRTSRAVPQPSTDRALCRLTSEVERAPVHSTRYGRQLIKHMRRTWAPVHSTRYGRQLIKHIRRTWHSHCPFAVGKCSIHAHST